MVDLFDLLASRGDDLAEALTPAKARPKRPPKPAVAPGEVYPDPPAWEPCTEPAAAAGGLLAGADDDPDLAEYPGLTEAHVVYACGVCGRLLLCTRHGTEQQPGLPEPVYARLVLRAGRPPRGVCRECCEARERKGGCGG